MSRYKNSHMTVHASIKAALQRCGRRRSPQHKCAELLIAAPSDGNREAEPGRFTETRGCSHPWRPSAGLQKDHGGEGSTPPPSTYSIKSSRLL